MEDKYMGEVIKNTLVLVPQNMIEKEIPGISTIEVEVKKDSQLPLVRLGKDLCNYFNEERNGFISRECFKNAEEFITIEGEKYAIVQRLNFAWNILKSDGSFLSKNEDFKSVYYSSSFPFIVERKNEKFNLLKLDGRFVSPNEDFLAISEYFMDDLVAFRDKVDGNFVKVQRADNTVNYFKINGGFVSQNEDFLAISLLDTELMTAMVKRKNGFYNFLRIDGTLVSPNEDFLDANAIFKKDIKTNKKMFLVQRKNKKYN